MNPGEAVKAPVGKDLAVSLINDLYGLRASNVMQLTSYVDKNFFFEVNTGAEKNNHHLSGMHICLLIGFRFLRIIPTSVHLISFLYIRQTMIPDLSKEGYILKVTNWKESEEEEFFVAQHKMTSLLASGGLDVPVC